ncbi:MAG TPA: SUMF1/EgtB/PvdO family nonheme iron enzyme [Polyangiales bacterium]|nr:SUMF1/EgtB/PvdO family nonheme iron enzyme [Polyangiales bacterium]
MKVTQADLSYGFAKGLLRSAMMVPSFKITKHPITRAEYDDCVGAGVCTKNKQEGCSADAYGRLSGHSVDRAKSPVSCVTPTQARTYCEWIGGRLPSMPEWMLAARGPLPAQYAWGESPPTCQQHPRAAEVLGAFPTQAMAEEAGCAPATETPLVVGEYAQGAAASGMQDVLLTPGELVATRRDDEQEGCASDLDACFVYGREPASIEAAYPLSKTAEGAARKASLSPHVYGFRCVVERKQDAH